MEYYSDSITPSIIKVYGITAKINSHSKFFQGKYTSTKRNTYWDKSRVACYNETRIENLLTSQNLLETSIGVMGIK